MEETITSSSRQKRDGEVTRQRILEAAIDRFARAPYEQVGLRDIAADVGVDVALVHRAYGSKERLFAEAFAVAAKAARLLAADGDQLGAVFARFLFEPGSVEDPSAKALQIFTHSLPSPQAAEIFRQFTMNDMIGPIAAKSAEPGPLRAALFVACLTGVSILREVLHVAPLDDAGRTAAEPLIAKLLDTCLAAETGTEGTTT